MSPNGKTPMVACGDLQNRVEELKSATGIIGSAPHFLNTLKELAQFAQVDVPVLITGETGTGKELAARAVHYLSKRRDGPFVPVNCGALPERLFENELFGHGKGAFTDAREAQRGLVALAQGGTLLLDEIDCLDLHSQAALLRFLQDQRYRPLGAGADLQADVRVVASTNARLDEHVAAGRFRMDLMFRLDVARVDLPPLRLRRDDVLPLARHFATRAAERYGFTPPLLSPRLEKGLHDHPWNGNIRELENAMHRAVLLAGGAAVIVAIPRICDTAAHGADAVAEEQEALSEPLKTARARCARAFENKYLIALLRQTAGNISEAARKAGTERRHLGRMLQRHGIDAGAFRG